MTLEDIIKEMQQEIETTEQNILEYGKTHNATIRLIERKKSISKYLQKVKKLNEAIVSEDDFCVVCDEKASTHPVCVKCLAENNYNRKQK